MTSIVLVLLAAAAAAWGASRLLARRGPRTLVPVALLGLGAAVAVPLLLHERLRGERRDGGPDPVPAVDRPDAPGPAPGAVGPVRFAVWGDRRSGAGVFERVCASIADDAPEFSVGLGDLVGMARTYQFEIVRERLAGTGAPAFVVPGNHDRDPFGTLRPYARAFGPATWAFEHRGVAFLGLDTSLGVVNVRDLDALEGWLAKRPRAPAVLFVHHPPFPPAGRTDKALGHQIGNLRLRDRVLERRIHVFASHYHGFDDREVAPGVRQVTTGGAGARPEADAPYHWVRASVDPASGALTVERVDVARLDEASEVRDRLLVLRDEAAYAAGAFPLAVAGALLGFVAFLAAVLAGLARLVRGGSARPPAADRAG